MSVVVLFAIGAWTSVMIDGRPVFVGSTEAQAHRMVLTMEDDILALVEADELLALPTSEARARVRELESMSARMESLSARWSRTQISELPTGEFAPVATSLAGASFASVEALNRKTSLLGSNDARVTAELAAFRETLITEVLEAGPELVALGEQYGVDVTLGAPQARE